jgi:quinol monooxygenase YgiN
MGRFKVVILSQGLTPASVSGKTIVMSSVVSIHPYFKVHEGKLNDFKDLLPRFISATAAEEKCYWYDFTICGDIVHCREAYEGAEGLLAHVANVEALIGEALGMSELLRIEVHGPLDELEKLQEPLAELNPDYFGFHSGMIKPAAAQ